MVSRVNVRLGRVPLQAFPEAAHAVLSMAESQEGKAVQSGHWVGICSPRHIERRLLNAKFETL